MHPPTRPAHRMNWSDASIAIIGGIVLVYAIILALVLRSVLRKAGHAALERHWPGTPAGLALVHRLDAVSG
jgi:hypothetical protein